MKEKKMKICHVTTAHDPHDLRILYKECSSLNSAGYSVQLIAPNAENEVVNGVRIIGVKVRSQNRYYRFLFIPRRIYEKCLEVNADLYHFHDPDFIDYALKLRKMGKKVIYDVHEDYPLNILGKQWIPKPLRKTVSRWFAVKEARAARQFSGIVSVTPQIVDRLHKLNPNVAMVTNYPIIDDKKLQNEYHSASNHFCFAGTIEHLRRIDLIIEVLEDLNLTFDLAGNMSPSFHHLLTSLPGWEKVNYHGYIPYSKVLDIYKDSLFGVMIEGYHPINYNNEGSLGVTKMFEFMMLGLPVICTDFTLHRQIIEQYRCGICVRPDSRSDIRNAMLYLMEHRDEAKKMGERGRQAVTEQFNWKNQEQNLFKLYEKLLE